MPDARSHWQAPARRPAPGALRARARRRAAGGDVSLMVCAAARPTLDPPGTLRRPAIVCGPLGDASRVAAGLAAGQHRPPPAPDPAAAVGVGDGPVAEQGPHARGARGGHGPAPARAAPNP